MTEKTNHIEPEEFYDIPFPLVQRTTLGLFHKLERRLPLHDEDPAGTFISFCEDIIKSPDAFKKASSHGFIKFAHQEYTLTIGRNRHLIIDPPFHRRISTALMPAFVGQILHPYHEGNFTEMLQLALPAREDGAIGIALQMWLITHKPIVTQYYEQTGTKSIFHLHAPHIPPAIKERVYTFTRNPMAMVTAYGVANPFSNAWYLSFDIQRW